MQIMSHYSIVAYELPGCATSSGQRADAAHLAAHATASADFGGATQARTLIGGCVSPIDQLHN